MEKELKSCPFCSGKALYRCSNDGDYIECSVCGLGTTIHERGHPNAVSRWNTRTASAREARLVDALELIAKGDMYSEKETAMGIAREALADINPNGDEK